MQTELEKYNTHRNIITNQNIVTNIHIHCKAWLGGQLVIKTFDNYKLKTATSK